MQVNSARPRRPGRHADPVQLAAPTRGVERSPRAAQASPIPPRVRAGRCGGRIGGSAEWMRGWPPAAAAAAGTPPVRRRRRRTVRERPSPVRSPGGAARQLAAPRPGPYVVAAGRARRAARPQATGTGRGVEPLCRGWGSGGRGPGQPARQRVPSVAPSRCVARAIGQPPSPTAPALARCGVVPATGSGSASSPHAPEPPYRRGPARTNHWAFRFINAPAPAGATAITMKWGILLQGGAAGGTYQSAGVASRSMRRPKRRRGHDVLAGADRSAAQRQRGLGAMVPYTFTCINSPTQQ